MSIKLSVPLIVQQGTMACWYASATMILRYQKGVDLREFLVDNSFTSALVQYTNSGLNPAFLGDFAKTVGLRMSTFTPTPKLIEQALTKWGPLWYGGVAPATKYGGASLHAVVITGIEHVKELKQDWVLYNDPFPPGEQTDSEFSDFFNKEIVYNRSPFLHA